MSGTAPDEMDVSRLAIVVVVVRPSHGKARREMTTKKTLFVTHLHHERAETGKKQGQVKTAPCRRQEDRSAGTKQKGLPPDRVLSGECRCN